MPDQTPGNRLVITDDDLASGAVEDRVRQLEAAKAPAMTRTVGAPHTGPSSSFGVRTIAVMTALGFAGGVLGFVLSEVIGGGDEARFDNTTQNTMLFTSLFTAGLGLVLIAWDGVAARSGRKVGLALGRGLPVVVAGGAIGGFLAQQLYYPFAESAIERAFREATSEEEAFDIVMNALRVPRGIAFMLVGICIGAALGVVYRSWKRAQNGVIGGAIGGFIGGLLFNWVGEAFNSDSGATSRLVTLVLIGTLIGLAVGAVDTIRKDAWLHIVSGGMAGKQFIVYRERCTIGSGGEVDITLIKDPAIALEHVELVLDGQGARFRNLAPHLPVSLNGQAASDGRLQDGSLLQIGGTVLQFGAKAAAMPEFDRR
jgi:hypothetical protein